MADYGSTDRVRRLAAEKYIAPARRRGDKVVTIHSGTLARVMVEKELLQPNRFPIVCNALRSKRFAQENHLTLQEERTTAASGQSSTVDFVYRLNADETVPSPEMQRVSFSSMRGLLKKTYTKLGGAESFHNAERKSWNR